METFSALLAICAGNSPVPGEFPAQKPVTRSFDVFFDLRLNKRLSKQWWGWWFGTQLFPLWRHRNAFQWFRHFHLGKQINWVLKIRLISEFHTICKPICSALFCCGYDINPCEYMRCIHPYSEEIFPALGHSCSSDNLAAFIHCDLVTPYGDMNLGQRWPR